MATRRTLYLNVRKLAGGGYGYYWTPSPALRKAGWEDVNFGPSPSDNDEAKFKLAEARNDLVTAWRTGGETPRQIKAIVARHTIGALIDAFLAHCQARVAEKAKPKDKRNPLVGTPMAQNTLDGYTSKSKTIRLWGTTPGKQALDPPPGDIAVASITHDNVLKFRDALMEPDEDGQVHHHTAHGTLRVLRTMLGYAEAEGMIPKGSNPAEDFQLATPPARTAIWDEDGGTDDFDTFYAACDLLKRPSVALGVDVGSWSAQRMSDVLSLGRQQWKTITLRDKALVDALRGDDPDLKGFTLTQRKTDTPGSIPILQPLRAKVEETFARNLAMDPPQLTLLINERTGRPYDRFSFSDAVREVREFCVDPPAWAIAQGFVPRPSMAKLQFMDLRRTRVCWLHDRGIDPLGISMITLHSPKTVEQILASTYRPRNNRGVSVTLLAAHGATPRKGDADQEKQA